MHSFQSRWGVNSKSLGGGVRIDCGIIIIIIIIIVFIDVIIVIIIIIIMVFALIVARFG